MAEPQSPLRSDATKTPTKPRSNPRPSFKVGGYSQRDIQTPPSHAAQPRANFEKTISFSGRRMIHTPIPSTKTASPQPPNINPSEPPPQSSDAPLFVHQTPADILNAEVIPPSKKRKCEQKRAVARSTKKRTTTVLRPSRPLKISDQVNGDVWHLILGYCEPKQLLEAKLISKDFNTRLNKHSTIWRKSRLDHFGKDIPECPTGLTEQQYVYLLVGRGCQNPNCPRDQTVRVAWVFQLRLCADCFKQKTIRVEDLLEHRRHFINPDPNQPADPSPLWGSLLSDLLPQARTDGRRYGGPRVVDVSRNMWTQDVWRQYVFLESAYTKLETEYLALRQTNPTNTVVKEWLERTYEKVMAFMKEAAELEKWNATQSQDKPDYYQIRGDFFEERAAALNPPIEHDVLWNMAAFRNFLKIQSPPTERSWARLQSQILPYRQQAEQVLEYKEMMDDAPLSYEDVDGPSRDTLRLWMDLKRHRQVRKRVPCYFQPEQSFVLRLAQKELQRCLDSGIADEDLLLLTLHNVYVAYQQLEHRPIGLNYDGTRGPYQLSLDDARMIVEDVIEAKIDPTSQRGSMVFSQLRCRGCRRRDFTKTWSFTDAFEHILNTHAMLVGEGIEFWRFAVPFIREQADWRPTPDEVNAAKSIDRFPWYSLPWPECLPLVPVHREPWKLDKWQPSTSETYIELEKPPTISAFQGRAPASNSFAKTDFVGNIRFAAQVLNGARLNDECQMKIALTYAMERWKLILWTKPPLDLFSSSMAAIQEVNPTISLQFRCGICVKEGVVNQNARQVKYRIAADDLLAHWRTKHQDQLDWTEAINLPSDNEVERILDKADTKLQQEKDAAHQRKARMDEDIRKRPKLKNNVVINSRLARDVFDELFPRTG
ncbi:hypothetical protein PV08_09671 [Exophiala spinifera]|uniref:F-box domain-containing protein n=1 Tax=Exophiala spinifera TaxID=91928 RepID=A0A0D2BMK7_9EURO|nr:uncharacterized protein PV08_09671 [Exophiala spinifera]KIW12394.1 hypothetical protein PV08_09671 [Exophiala spinifera]